MNVTGTRPHTGLARRGLASAISGKKDISYLSVLLRDNFVWPDDPVTFQVKFKGEATDWPLGEAYRDGIGNVLKREIPRLEVIDQGGKIHHEFKAPAKWLRDKLVVNNILESVELNGVNGKDLVALISIIDAKNRNGQPPPGDGKKTPTPPSGPGSGDDGDGNTPNNDSGGLSFAGVSGMLPLVLGGGALASVIYTQFIRS